MAKHPFSEADQNRIKEAVAAAETKTAGEIVPYYVSESDDYQEATWRGGLIFAILGLLAASGLLRYYGDWSSFGSYEALGIVFGSLALGVALSYIPLLRRWLAGRELLDRRTRARALEAFVEEEVFDTEDRTGILIFMSMFERRVIVIGDSGINAKVGQSDWNEVVDLIRSGMKAGNPTNGLVDAIKKCGQLLHKKGVEIQEDDSNELSDSLRIGD